MDRPMAVCPVCYQTMPTEKGRVIAHVGPYALPCEGVGVQVIDPPVPANWFDRLRNWLGV